MDKAKNRKGLRPFLTIWVGQLVSIVGSGMTSFALGVWVYEQSGSVVQFSLVVLFGSLPGLLLSPFSGVLTDRWNRRRVMLLSDSGAAVTTLVLIPLLWLGRLELWQVIVVAIVGSAFQTFQWPAYSAAISQLVPKEQLGRANGLVQFAQAGGSVASPLIAGFLMVQVGLLGVVVIDLTTYLVAVSTLLLVRIPKAETTREGSADRGKVLKEARNGFRYIVQRPGLARLLAFFAVVNFTGAMAYLLVYPLVLGIASSAVLGTTLSAIGFGMLTGGVVMSTWGGPQRRIHGILLFGLLQGSALVLSGLQPNIWLIGASLFLWAFAIPIINGCSQSIWQSKTAHDIQGRVFAFRSMVAQGLQPVAYLLAGPLAEHVFEPLLAPGGPLAGTLGGILGVGDGRGVALLLIVLGGITLAAPVLGYASRRLVRLEDELPDAAEGEAKEAPAAASV